MRNILIVLAGLFFCAGCVPLLAAGGVNTLYGWQRDRAIEQRVSNLEEQCLPKPQEEQSTTYTQLELSYLRMWSPSTVHGSR